jgi:predicted transcriptional regulator
MTVQEIAAAVGAARQNVKKLLSILHREGEVDLVTTEVYRMPDPQVDMPF